MAVIAVRISSTLLLYESPYVSQAMAIFVRALALVVAR
jgi:hypothetical protein